MIIVTAVSLLTRTKTAVLKCLVCLIMYLHLIMWLRLCPIIHTFYDDEKRYCWCQMDFLDWYENKAKCQTLIHLLTNSFMEEKKIIAFINLDNFLFVLFLILGDWLCLFLFKFITDVFMIYKLCDINHEIFHICDLCKC